jgi:hypothetical protein
MKFAKIHYFQEIYLAETEKFTIFANSLWYSFFILRKSLKKTGSNGKSIKKNSVSGAIA